MRVTILCLTLSLVSAAQAPIPSSPSKKGKVSDPAADQQALKAIEAQANALRAAANAAYAAEMKREKAPICPNAATSDDRSECIAREDDFTETNYKAFTAALRALLALSDPQIPGETSPDVGPGGTVATPAEEAAAFDTAESAWHAYAKAECSAVVTFWSGGTIVFTIGVECDIRMTRARLHELNIAYGDALIPQ
jgi:uncharacterized protein YecT (DUF1311 family)